MRKTIFFIFTILMCASVYSQSMIDPDDIQKLKKIYANAPEIHKAVIFREFSKVKKLVESNPSLVNARDKYQWTPLHCAAYVGNKQIAQYLVSKGANIDAKDNRGDTPLYYAASTGHNDVLKFLISKGAQVNVVDKHKWTPIGAAMHQGHSSTVRILKQHGAKLIPGTKK